MSIGSCSTAGTCSFEHDTAKKKGKGDQEAQLKETIQQNDNMPERQRKDHLGKVVFLRVSTTEEEIAVTIESVVTGIYRIAKTSRKNTFQM